MLDKTIFQKYPQMLEYPREFHEFINMCYGIPINIEIYKHTNVENDISALLDQRSFFEEETKGYIKRREIEIGQKHELTGESVDLYYEQNDTFYPTYDYYFVNEGENVINFTWFEVDYNKTRNAIKDYEQYKKRYESRNFKTNDKDTNLDWIEKEIDYLKSLQKKFDEKTPIYRGSVITPDLIINLSENLIQATISTLLGKIIVLYGYLGEDKKLKDITLASYNIFDFANDYKHEYFFPGMNPETYAYEPVIDSEKIKEKVEKLTASGIQPEVKIDLNFKEFLNEVNLEEMYEKPIAAIYYAKEFLLKKIQDTVKQKSK